MHNKLKCLEFETPDELISYLDSSKSDFLIQPASFWVTDILNTVWIVDSIRSHVASITSQLQPDADIVSLLSSLHQRIRFQSFWIDKFFNPPPREQSDGIRRGPVCVIFEKDSDISYINNAYVEATWLWDFSYEEWSQYLSWDELNMSLVDKIKHLSYLKVIHKNPEIWETSLLNTIIYSEPELVRLMSIIKKKANDDNWSSGIFTMKLTNKSFLWRIHRSDKIKWSAFSAVEVNPKHPLEKRFKMEAKKKAEWTYEDVKNYPYWLYDTVFSYKTAVDQVMNWMLNWEMNRLFNELRKRAVIWSLFIDESDFLVWWFDWKNKYFNREFSLNTNLSPQELRESLDEWWDFVSKVYWKWDNTAWVKEHFDSLRRQEHHFSELYPIVGSKKRVVTYDTFRYDYCWNDCNIVLDQNWHLPEWSVIKKFWVWLREI
ncbi:MAG: hypothetical protein ACD_2C00188G0001 [uncultured bacterium (gcode 4)]|uniref:Uncharacterized protein n=1 Tax=uncultured bacterium (gcode 4) TaxID=1234023 RepID=K2G298_9BACT|nr:MAG: hypothetical protein ACD_2C00188G0001 [uncultured bacterium (gcode 4)]